jgi:hypothetical protein
MIFVNRKLLCKNFQMFRQLPPLAADPDQGGQPEGAEQRAGDDGTGVVPPSADFFVLFYETINFSGVSIFHKQMYFFNGDQ